MQSNLVQGFRLSPQQQHLWRVSQEGARPPAVQCVLELTGALERRRLRAALATAVARHEILRTRFPLPRGLTLPLQVVGDPESPVLEVVSLRGLGGAAESAFAMILAAHRDRPFDLEAGLPLRAVGVELDPERHRVVLTLPALVADAASAALLGRDVAMAYAGTPLEDEVLQYADSAEILHEWLSPEDFPEAAAYWRSLDLTAASRGRLPARGAPDAPPGVVVERLAPEIVSAVRRVAVALEVPPAEVVFAAWCAALWCSTGEDHLLVARAFDGRTAVELETGLGPYARYLPIGLQVDGDATLRGLLATQHGVLGAAAEWQDAYPHELGENLLAAGAGIPRWPFGFEVAAADAEVVSAPRLVVSVPWAEGARFDVRLRVCEGAETLSLELHYDGAAVGPGDVRRLGARLRRLLETVTAQPDLPLEQIDVLSPEERRELFHDFHRTGWRVPSERCAHELFLERSRRSPEAVALVCGNEHWSCRELEVRTRRICGLLLAAGVGPGTLVGVCLERSPGLVAGILGVLEAGMAYLPLDPSLPSDRLRVLLADSGASVLLTNAQLLSRLDRLPAGVVRVDAADAEGLAAAAPADPPSALPEGLAYVIYTSGSTGRPKGVMVSHRGLTNYLAWAADAYRVKEGHAPVHSSIGFDLTVTALLAPLVAGGTVALVPEDDPLTGLVRMLRRTPMVSLLKVTPSHLDVLGHLMAPAELAGRLGTLVVGGEALHQETLAPWRDGVPAVRVVNEYGPTETVVGCSVHTVAPDEPRIGAVPIGRSMAGARLLVMGPGGRPVPWGAAGELWVGGPGVALGYLGRPGVTAERFVPDAVGGSLGERLYRTGDRVRLGPEGSLRFLGRTDHQIKLRGHRIEPGEIEAALTALPAVGEAVVALRETSAGPVLAAYVVPAPGGPLDREELRAALEAVLPAYMVPAAIVPLRALPLTANGKVDRGALPDPSGPGDGAATPYAAPRSVEEELLADLWARVLGAERIGIDDNFFALGGDSIRSVQLVSLAQERGVDLSVQDVFDHPTLRALCARPAAQRSPVAPDGTTEPFSLLPEDDRRRLPAGLEDAYPLARLQAGMLFHSELRPGSAIFHDLHSFHLEGRFGREALETAIRQTVRRHAVLRTRFDLAGPGEPLQMVLARVEAPLTVEDLSDLPEAEQRQAVTDWLAAERERGFDWSRPPLVRFHVHVRSGGTFQFTLSFHHSILDGWSAASLLSELFRRYAALSAGAAPVEDRRLEATFRDFVAAERAVLESHGAHEFWRRHLAGAVLCAVPRETRAESRRRRRAAEVRRPLPDAVADGLERAAREAGVPVKSLALAAHFRVLGWLAGQTDVVTGVVSNGRPEGPDGERVLGLFLNTLPLRIQLDGGTWSDLGRAAFELERSSLAYRRFPLAEIQRLHGGAPLFETAFNYIHYHVYQSTFDLPGVRVLERSGYEETDFVLLAHVSRDPAGSRLRLVLSYQEAELDASEVESIADRYLRCLESMASDVGARYEEVSPLTPLERDRVLVEWGRGAPLAEPPAGLHEAFLEQARRSPDAPALLRDSGVVTYGELARRSGRVARHLRDHGVEADELVGVFAERGPDLVAALLGILRAGAAYLPLDPAYPGERVAFTVCDAGVRLILADDAVADRLPATPAVVLPLASLTRGGGVEEPGPEPRVDPQSLAYAIYTSGSTGRPKGVGIPHAGASALVAWGRTAYGPEDLAAVAASTSVCFDLSVFELFVPLASGGGVVLVDDALALASLPAGSRVTLVNTVPSALEELLRIGALPAAVRVLNLAGEALGRDLVDAASALPGSPVVANLYGPTEDTTYSTGAAVPAGEEGPPAVGRPLSGRESYLLDHHLQPVPPRTRGEVALGGAGLARGYLGRPGLTAERFVPDPVSGRHGRRLYRTGDLARHRPDGQLEFLGRLDHQVKLRGHRIELGEVEQCLVRHAGVREVAAAVVEVGGDPRIVAYVGAPGDSGADLEPELRERARAWLPAYMVPSRVVVLDALPRTPNGKVDRARLPAPRDVGTAASARHRPPREGVEQVLAEIVAGVLARDEVGAHESFFDLGGHSLLATRVVSRARRVLGVDLPLRALFDEPTVAGLARVVEGTALAAADGAQPPLVPVPRRGATPVSLAQRRLWFVDRLEPGSPAYNVPVAVRLDGSLDPASLATSFTHVVERHEVLRSTFGAGEDGEPVQRVAPPGRVPLPVIDLTSLGPRVAEGESRRLTNAEARRPFDLEDGPLVRCSLLRRRRDQHVLLLTQHHVVTDGWSIGVLVGELSAAYAEVSAGRRPRLDPLPIQYGDFASWQRSWLQGRVLDEQLAFWRARLQGSPPTLDLPADRPRPKVPSGLGGLRSWRVPAGVVEHLRALGREEGASLFMLLLALFDGLLARYTGGEDLVVGTDVANRGRPETEPLIGFFVNQLALRVDVAGDPTFRELLARARETCLEAYAHSELPFERVVEEVNPTRDLSRQPVFQVVLALQPRPRAPIGLPDLTVAGEPVVGSTAKLDLTVVAGEVPDGLRIAAEYATDLFDATTVDRLLRHLGALAAAVALRPDLRLSALPILDSAERHQLDREWNDSAAAVPHGSFEELLQCRIAERPEAVAGVFDGRWLSYRELDRRAGAVAGRLAALGAGPGTVIALLADRGLDFLAAVLGSFRVGGAYLPLDPHDPIRRLVDLVVGSGARVVLCARRLVPGIEAALRSASRGAPVVALESVVAGGDPVAGSAPPPVGESDLAYVIYTSGSTGRPKGAMVEQRGMVNHLWAKVRDLGLGPDDVVAQTASQCFDISVWQFLAPLLVGGRVRVVPDDLAHDPFRLLEEVERTGVTILETVPSLMRVMLDELGRTGSMRPRLESLRWLIPTGEALPPALSRRWLGLYPGTPLLNAYGPTECSDDVTHHRITTAGQAGRERVPIGRAVANLRLHVLGTGAEPLPAGVPGELFVGGAGVGRGYLGEGRRTADAWRPDPYAGIPGGRLYRTGDLARRLPDGALEFLGRIDHQVKIRGNRIELGEVESTLERHERVREVAVLARGEGADEQRLVAYVVAAAGDEAADLEKVEEWRSIFDEVYSGEERAAADPGIDLRVWVSSYTGRPLPEAEILECVEDSVARILALRPDRVLEIGCGTGLVLTRVAPHCSAYCGSDLSREVLGDLSRQIAGVAGLPPIELLERSAADFRDLPPESFDTVVLNEVVQYFPSAAYLVRVLEGAVQATAAGGSLFIGGLRSLPLLEAFHASVAIHQADEEASLDEVRREVQRRLSREKELVVDPGLFAAFARANPRVTGMTLQLKGGRSRNELTRFRYDVVLQVKGPGTPVHRAPHHDWEAESWSLETLERRLRERPQEVLFLSGIPDARLASEVAALDLLRAGELANAGELRRRIGAASSRGVEPTDLWALGHHTGHTVEIRWSSTPGRLDVRISPPDAARRPLERGRPGDGTAGAWDRYANNPARSAVAGGLVPELRAYLAERLPEFMVPSLFVFLDTMPRTPNGKLDRKALPAPGTARPELSQDYVAPLPGAEAILAGIWAEILRLDRVGAEDNFFELGGDSILSIQVVSRASRHGLRITPRQMFQYPTLTALAAVAEEAAPGAFEEAPSGGSFPLTPIQRWFFEQEFTVPGRWNQAVLLQVREVLALRWLAAAVAVLFDRHDALRLRFEVREGDWRQHSALPGGTPPFTWIDLGALPETVRSEAVARAAHQLHDGIDFVRGPIGRVAYLGPTADGSGRLAFMVHHLAVDGVSWTVLLEDLETTYRALQLPDGMALLAPSTPFRRWAEWLAAHGRSAAAAERDYWLASSRRAGAPLPVDFPATANTVAYQEVVTLRLDPPETERLLREAPAAYRMGVDEVLLTALAQVVASWTGRRTVLFDVEGHGRDAPPEDLDVSRTVGWFTTQYPVLLELPGDPDPGAALRGVKEQLREVPAGGLGYGLLRYLDPEAGEELAALPPADLLFNYLGRVDRALAGGSSFALAPEPSGRATARTERRTHLLEINGWVGEGRLRLDWSYSSALHRRSTIEELVAQFHQALRVLIDHCAGLEAGGYTPADFAAARLSQSQLDSFLSKIAPTPEDE